MRKALLIIPIIIAGVSFLVSPAPAFAAEKNDHCVKTIILGDEEVCDKEGDSLFALLRLIIDIMTIGVGILGVIGISVTGVQYLTAGAREDKAQKAKRRMFEIIIGLAVYAIFFLLMRWVFPNFEIPDETFKSSFENTTKVL